jgi:putative ABC transport system ATP-binding protein
MILSVTDVKKTYELGAIDVPALMGVSLGVEKGSFVSIMGPSGSGKSTLMNIIGCLDHPTEGIVKIDEIETSNMDRSELAYIRNKKIGFIFQSFNLLPRINARVMHKPNELSGGQKQRVAIARALVNDPAIILADEPTGNVDSRSGLEIMALLQKVNREGMTILMVTHDRYIAQHSERIIHFSDGLIVKEEVVEESKCALKEYEKRFPQDRKEQQ